MSLVVAGFVTGLSLIAAIGAQNAFVLRMAIARRFVLPVIAICVISDACSSPRASPGSRRSRPRSRAIDVIRWAGAAFLICYGLFAARRALKPSALSAAPGGAVTIGAALLTCLALTWLNPHTYLDTVLMLGSVANHYGNPGRWWFGAGAITASVVWFAALGYGARYLRAWFAKPSSCASSTVASRS